MIPYGRQHITQADIEAVVDVLQSDFLTQGPKVPAFERAVADKVGAKHAVAVNSGTSALHVACLSLGLGPGDMLWTSPITFVASANCARYCGADVDFVDIDPRTYNLSPARLAQKLEKAKAENRLPKVVVPVHMSGQSCEMAAIHALSKKFGFYIIEDACHAIGGSYKGEPVGNGRYSDITVFSFHPLKNITSAEGGMAVTNHDAFAEKMGLLRSHGITRDRARCRAVQSGNASFPAYYYEQIELGYNYRMSDVQAALGLSQLSRLDEFVAKRHELARRYDDILAQLPVTIPWRHPDTFSGMHLYIIRLERNRINKTHNQVFEELREAGIGVNLHYIPVYLQPDFAMIGFAPGYCPEAERYYAEAITLPMFPGLTDEDIVRVGKALRSIIS